VAEVSPAPKRGRYDRSLSRHARQAEQRERLLVATAAVAAAGRELNVANVVSTAGVGRNTFYEYFDDFPHALRALAAHARAELSVQLARELELARTPLERVRAIARGWVRNARSNEQRAMLMLRRHEQPTQGGASPLGSELTKFLGAEGTTPTTLPGLRDGVRIVAIVAVFEAITQELLARDEDQHLSALLADLALRILR